MAGPRPGEVLNDRYELIDRIGGGSMGEVWRGRDLVLGRTVAVKIVLPALLDTPTFRARFVAEARVMAMMDHPGIVRVYDYGYTDATDPDTPGAAFLVMEFIEGESLDRVLARTGALEPRFAMKVLASLLDALGAVHRTGVVHRDVKPANVMLTSGGVVLADFGIARSPESLGLTAADALMGTVPYLAPELFHAETPTPAADVYAVGILGYELLSGRQPFQAASTAAVMYMHMHEPPPPLPDYVAAPVAEVLWHALEKDPAHRWADGAEMAAAVRHVLAGPVEVGEDLAGNAGMSGRYGGYGGTPSGYEDTLTDSGGRRRRRPPAAAEGGYAAAGGAAGTAASAYADGLYGDGGTDGRYGRDAAFGESAASGFGGRGPGRGRGDYENYGDYGNFENYENYENGYPGSYGHPSDLEDTADLGPTPPGTPGTMHGALPPDATRVYDGTAPTAGLAGRGGQAADVPDSTRVYDLPSAMADSGGGRHAGPATYRAAEEPPVRRRGADSYQSRGPQGSHGTHGAAGGFGSRGGALRPDVRRKALLTAAVAVPAMLGLSVALAVSSSGKAPDGGGPGSGPAQQTDVPTAGTGTDDMVPPTEPVPTSTSVYGHTSARHTYTTYPTYGHSSGYGSSGPAIDPTGAGHPGTPTDSGSAGTSNQLGPPSSTNSTALGTSTPPSSPSSYPSSSPS